MYGADQHEDEETEVVVGVVEEVEQIPRMLQLEDEAPFVREAYRVGLVNPEPEDVREARQLEFLHDAEMDQVEIPKGEQQALACIKIFKV